MTDYYENTEDDAKYAKLAIKAAFESATHPYGTERNRFCFHTSPSKREYLLDAIKEQRQKTKDKSIRQAITYTQHALEKGDLPDRSHTSAQSDRELERGMTALSERVSEEISRRILSGDMVPRFATAETLEPESHQHSADYQDLYI